MQSNGGVMGVDTACRRPVRTALSGPAAGVIAAGHIARSAGFDNVVTGDVGGTSFDVSLIAGGRSALGPGTSVDFGLTIRTPMIEITTIGAGGGSIAWVDAGGLLNIGPESAGSNPGPVAYGLGNDRPTVTDANVVLGRIDPDGPIGGDLERLDVEAAGRAIDAHVGRALGLDTVAAAEAILRVANSRMAGAIRLVSIERGFDPKRFVFMPFGGGGALHAGALLADTGIARALVPRYPGVTSAMGCVIADMRQDFVQTLNAPLEALDEAALAETMQSHVDRGNAMLDASNTTFVAREMRFELDMSYAGQTHAVVVPLAVPVEDGRVGPTARGAIGEAFDESYRASFGRPLAGGVRRVINLRSAVIGERAKFDLRALAPARDGTGDGTDDGATSTAPPPRATRRVHFGTRWHDTAVHDRLALPVGAVIEGPAILEQPDTTVLIEPGLQGRVDALGNTLLEGVGAHR